MLKQYPQAIETLYKAINIDPLIPESYYEIGLILNLQQ